MENMTLKQKYETSLRDTLVAELGYKNYLEAPKLTKVVLNVGIGHEGSDAKVIDSIKDSLKQITGQAPSLRRAKKAIAGFKIREGDPVGLMVTLRGKRMFDFLKKLTNVVFPRVRDFRGLMQTNFDKNGNYSLGFPEVIVFPEIDMGNSNKTHGLEVTIVTTGKDKLEATQLLSLLGFKFKEDDKNPRSTDVKKRKGKISGHNRKKS